MRASECLLLLGFPVRIEAMKEAGLKTGIANSWPS
jgi:hypothetical protein